jgi:hypothetical protein
MALDSDTRCVHEGKSWSCLTFREVIDRLFSQVDPCAFASDQVVQVLLGEMEDLFTARFGMAFFEDCSRWPSHDVTRSEGRQEKRSGPIARGALSQDTPLQHFSHRSRSWSCIPCPR